MSHPLVKLLRWCRANVADGRVSLCRVEGQPICPHPCGPCLSVEKRAVAAERAQACARPGVGEIDREQL